MGKYFKLKDIPPVSDKYVEDIMHLGILSRQADRVLENEKYLEQNPQLVSDAYHTLRKQFNKKLKAYVDKNALNN